MDWISETKAVTMALGPYQRGGGRLEVPEGAVWGQPHWIGGLLLGRRGRASPGPQLPPDYSWGLRLR